MKLSDLGYSPSELEAKILIRECLQVIELYNWIIDGLILDFFSESLWSRFPDSWQNFLSGVSPPELGSWLSPATMVSSKKVFPLSLLALKALLKKLSLSRGPNHSLEETQKLYASPSIDSLLKVKVNPKKEHELQKMAGFINFLSVQTDTKSVIDIGSGIGHLSRRLFFLHDLQTTGLESQEPLCRKAREMDERYTTQRPKTHKRPQHIPMTISEETNSDESLFQDHGSFGLVGLHACGDLSSRVIRLFAESPKSSFLALATCCYMKGCSRALHSGHELSYEARELGCHALEFYVERLSRNDVESHLRVHAYRALLERMLLRRGEKYRHIALKTVPRAHILSFRNYALSATVNLEDEIVLTESELSEAQVDLEKYWWRVAVYYVIRLSVAPLVETVVFLDRYLYLKRRCKSTAILPLFDPCISPRNLVIAAIK